jgi:hypothetical protein
MSVKSSLVEHSMLEAIDHATCKDKLDCVGHTESGSLDHPCRLQPRYYLWLPG